jgi:hypothetical protein
VIRPRDRACSTASPLLGALRARERWRAAQFARFTNSIVKARKKNLEKWILCSDALRASGVWGATE